MNRSLFGELWRGFWTTARSRVLVCLLLHGLLTAGLCADPSSQISQAQKHRSLPAPSDYVGSLECARCHQEIYNSYKRTGMGRSMSSITPEWVNNHQTSGSVEDKNSNSRFEVSAAEGQALPVAIRTGNLGSRFFARVARSPGS